MILTLDIFIGIIIGLLIATGIFMGLMIKGDLYAVYKNGALTRVECNVDVPLDNKKFIIFTIIKRTE